jgi:hypothetical protein
VNREDIIQMAREAGNMRINDYYTNGVVTAFSDEQLEAFAKLVAEHERNEIANEWWLCYQSDLENGVKSLNEYESMKFFTNYPELAKFGKWIDKRGQA